jgi:small-conductance mechanosensitive channel/CRP-like cAMP-binding protein
MTFWQGVQDAAGMGGGLAWVALGFVVVALVLLALFPEERPRIRTAIILFGLSVLGFCIAGAMLAKGQSKSGTPFRAIHWPAALIGAVAMVNVASVVVFDVALSTIRLKTPRILRDLILAFAYIVIAITLLSREGVDLTGIIATSTVITAIIGLSFQDTLGNIMGGLALQMERTIHIGDWIKVDQVEGRVKEIRWRFTAIETRNWDTVVIPNSSLMKSQVILLGRREGKPIQHRQWVFFNVDFRYSPSDVVDAVQGALSAEPITDVATDPPPNCIFMDYKDSYGSYAVRYWLTDLAVDDPTNSVVRERIFYALKRANITPSIPAQSLFITEEDLSRRNRKHSEEIKRRADALGRVELFHSLTDEELNELADHLKVAPFVEGETITRQGAEAHWLYIIIKGTVEVRVTVDETGLGSRVAVLNSGDFFGEGGMMTGERRTATVNALSDVECYRLDKESFTNIITRRGEIAEDISRIMARRRVELEAVKEGLDEEAKRHRMRERQGDILDRIRHFFGAG